MFHDRLSHGLPILRTSLVGQSIRCIYNQAARILEEVDQFFHISLYLLPAYFEKCENRFWHRDWERVTRALERKFQRRWTPRHRVQSRVAYTSDGELKTVLEGYRAALYIFVSPQSRSYRRSADSSSIDRVCLAQCGNESAKQELMKLLAFTINEWIAIGFCPVGGAMKRKSERRWSGVFAGIVAADHSFVTFSARFSMREEEYVRSWPIRLMSRRFKDP